MSPGKLSLEQLGAAIGTLSERLDRVEADGRRHAQVLADCVMRLAKSIAALQDQVTMIREAAGLAPARRDS